MWQKKEEKDELSNQRVFTINHSDIPKGVTQCSEHSLIRLNDTEVKCTKCPTVLIKSLEDMKQYA